MPKQSLELKEALSRGLRSDENIDRNTDFLLDAAGYRPTPFGASMYEGVLQPYSIPVAHPFPQLFVGQEATVLADKTLVGEFDSTWTLTNQTTHTLGSLVPPDTLVPITQAVTAGGQWHFCDYGNTYFLFNGNAVVFKYQPVDALFTSTAILSNTGCIFRGRLFLGGLSSLVSSAYNTQVATFRTKGVGEIYSFDDNFIWWSSIGLEDAYWWWFPDIMTKEQYISISQRQESGFMRMPWQGKVLSTKPLGNGVMVYGENGISFLEPIYSDETGSAMKHTLISSSGIAGRASVGGDELLHLYIDTEGTFWSIDSRLQQKKLGYREFGSGLIQRATSISYDPIRKDFYISNNLEAYVRTETGLARIPQLVTSCQFTDNALMGFYEELESTEETSFRVWTDIFDFGTRSVKTIYELQLDTESPTDFKASVYYRNNSADQFRQSTPVQCGTDGRVPITATGIEFIVRVEAEVGKHKRLDRVQIVWDIRSKRSFEESL